MRRELIAAGAMLMATATTVSAAPAGWGEPWAETRGIYTFVLSIYRPPWGNRDWTIEQWQRHIDFLAFLGINHFQVMRAPWSERPAETDAERAQENLLCAIFAYAQERGMRTSVLQNCSFHGEPGSAWHVLSPNNPAHEHWQTLVRGYAYFAERYGELVDEWHMGVEDPGGCPRCAGSGWADFTPTEQCDPANPCCTVSDMIALVEAARTSVLEHNPDARMVVHTWCFNPANWWGLDPQYPSKEAEFYAAMQSAPADLVVGTHGMEEALTERLRSNTGREVIAWPFYLFDSEFSGGMTHIHFEWMQTHLRNMRERGFRTVIAHTTHMVFMMPAIYVYAGWLHDADRPESELLREFAGYLAGDGDSADALATAIHELALFWDALVGVANWERENLAPIEDAAPHRARLDPAAVVHLDAAHDAMARVTAVRATSEMPMVVSPEVWVGMLREQIEVTWSLAHMDQFLDPVTVAEAARGRIESAPEPLTRSGAEQLATELGTGRFLAQERLDRVLAYTQTYWPSPTQWESPLGLMYEEALRVVRQAQVINAGAVRIEGDALIAELPGHPPIQREITP